MKGLNSGGTFFQDQSDILVTIKALLAVKSGSSGFGSENVNKWWEATEVKILISAYKDQENLNNSKGSNICFTLENRCSREPLKSHGILEPKCDVPRENLPREMRFTVLRVTAPIVLLLAAQTAKKG